MVGKWGACFFAKCDKSGRHHFQVLIFPEMTISHRGNLALLLEQLAFAGFCQQRSKIINSKINK